MNFKEVHLQKVVHEAKQNIKDIVLRVIKKAHKVEVERRN